MTSFIGRIQKLCTPAYVYLVISIIALVLMGLQNVSDNTMYCAGSYSCAVSNTALIFIIKLLYIAFLTWVLNLICKSGAPVVSWVLVLLPLVLMFLLVGIFFLSKGKMMPTTRHGWI